MSKPDTWNAYTQDHFPDDWDGDDFAFLAQFVEEEFDASLVRVLNERDYKYELYYEND